MLKNFLRLLPVLALAVAAALPSPAAAAGGGGGTGITVTIGKTTLQGRVLATVPVTIMCDAPLAGTEVFGGVQVIIEQAYGKDVSHGSGLADFSVCPATPTTINVLVTPDLFPTPSTAFHGGPAVATAFASAVDVATLTIFEGGSIGPMVVKL